MFRQRRRDAEFNLFLPLALCSVLLSALLPFCLSAQNFTSIPPAHQIQHVPLHCDEDFGTMGSMVQADNGYLWMTTTKGILVFDGNKSILYRNSDLKIPIKSNQDKISLSDIRKDTLGNLYILTPPGNTILKIDQEKRVVEQEFIANQFTGPYTCMYDIDQQGGIHFLVKENNQDSMKVWNFTSPENPEFIIGLSKKQHGDVISFSVFSHVYFLRTTKGILRISRNSHQFDFHPLLNGTDAVTHADKEQDIFYFLNVNTQTVHYWNDQFVRPKSFAILPAEVHNSVIAFYVDGPLLYTVSGSNFFILDTLHRQYQNLSDAYYQMKVNDLPGSLSEDIMEINMADNRLCILTTQHLFMLDELPPPVDAFTEKIPTTNFGTSMRGLAEDEHQHIYVSYYNGISEKKPQQVDFKLLPALHNIDLEQYSAYTLTYRSPYLFWHSVQIDLTNNTIKQYIPNRPRGHVTQALVNDTLYSFIWYAHHLYAYDVASGTLDSIILEKEVTDDQDFPLIINKMIADTTTGTLWICTRMQGIKQITKKGKTVRAFSPEVLGTNTEEGINDMLLDGDVIWYACYDGLGKINTKTNEMVMYRDRVINAEGRHRSRIVYSILPDESRGFYLGTQKGLTYFDTAQLTYYHLDLEHPLSQPEFNRTSVLKSSDGRYYFGSTYGLYSFLPEELKMTSVTDSLRPVDLYSASIFNGRKKKYRYLNLADGNLNTLKLDPSETNLKFSFSVPAFDQVVFYSHRLIGLNDEWSEYNDDATITINSLPPGKFTLEVKASANADDTNASHYSLHILMPAYWYQKPWIIILLSLFFSGLIIMAIRYRYQQKWKRQKDLEKLRVSISSDLHDDVGSILSGVAMQSQMMSYEIPEQHKKGMLQISDMSREAMERMRDTVWAIDARKDKFENLIDRMRDFAEKNLERKNITHDFQVSGVDGSQFLSPVMRQNIYLIFKEAITNILKHSDASHVKINFTQEASQIQLRIQDNGVIQTEIGSSGLGISNMKMRAEKIGGKLECGYELGFRVELCVGM